jgi:hypothetical protein|tara:strand:+ start:614 stop:1033 length:420 start_codon:yes stop_codon:yes gene_type:complete
MPQVEDGAATSLLVKHCMGSPELASMYSVQFLSAINRGPLEVETGDWLMIATCGVHVVGVVAEMVQCFIPGSSSVHLRLENDWLVTCEDTSRGGVITVDKSQAFVSGDDTGLVIDVEHCAMIELYADERDTHYVFEYVY